MIAPYYQDDLVTLYLGDCREVTAARRGRGSTQRLTPTKQRASKARTTVGSGTLEEQWDQWKAGWRRLLHALVRPLAVRLLTPPPPNPPAVRCCATCKNWHGTRGYPAGCDAITTDKSGTEAFLLTDPPDAAEPMIITTPGFRCSLWQAATGCTCPTGEVRQDEKSSSLLPGWNPYCPEHGTDDDHG